MPLAASSTPRAADHAKRMVSTRSEEHLLFVCIIYPRGHYYFNMLFFLKSTLPTSHRKVFNF